MADLNPRRYTTPREDEDCAAASNPCKSGTFCIRIPAIVDKLAQEEFPRDLLVSRIVAWSKRADTDVVMKEIRELATQLEKKKKPP